jgi:hypothetical protein
MCPQIFAGKIRMNKRIDEREAEELVQGYLENLLTDQESARLHSFLRQNPAKVDLILDGLRNDLLIRTVVAEWMVLSTQKSSSQIIERAGLLQWLQRTLHSLREHPWITATVGAAAFAAIVLCGRYFSAVQGEPALADVQGIGVILERSGQRLAAGPNLRLQPGDVLITSLSNSVVLDRPAGASAWVLDRTRTNGRAVIRFLPEQTRIGLLPGTEFRLRSLSRGKSFELVEGKLEASVARQRPFRPMILKTPQAEARVIGTRFTLAVSSNATRLDVTEGLVRFARTSDERSVRVGPDHFAVAAADFELSELPSTGTILREYWTNVPGKFSTVYLTSSTNYPSRPDGRDFLSSFETDNQQVTNYGARIRGYLLPPATGNYTFQITAADGGELYVSSDDNPDHRQEIAHAEGPNGPTGKSTPLGLKAGRKYYIEVLQKTGKGSRHLAVSWEGPGRNRETISGEFLSPWKLK